MPGPRRQPPMPSQVLLLELRAVHAAAVAAERSHRVLEAGAPAVAAAEVAAGADGLDGAFVVRVLTGRRRPCTRPASPPDRRSSSRPCRPCCSRRRRCRSRCHTGRCARTASPCSRWVRQVPLSHQRPAGQSASITQGGAQASPMHIAGGAILERGRQAGPLAVAQAGGPLGRDLAAAGGAHGAGREQAAGPGAVAGSVPAAGLGRLLGAFLVGILIVGHRKTAAHVAGLVARLTDAVAGGLAADAVRTVQRQALVVRPCRRTRRATGSRRWMGPAAGC